LLTTIVLATLAIGLPIVMVLAIRFLWDRNLNLGHSKQIEKLIWQLHRIASAQEHQMNLSYPAVQPGTEEPRDLAYLQHAPAQPAVQPSAPALSAAPAQVSVPAPRPAPVQPSVAPAPVAAPAVAAQPLPAPAAAVETPALPELPAEGQRRGGVNSMFGL
jgi:hypothetical protein